MNVRGIVLVVFFASALGAAVELLLLEHTETVWQLIPLILLGIGVLAGGTAALRPGRGTIRTFQGVMALCFLAGLIGLYLHYRGNAEFELEMYPSLTGLDLFREALMGATPALAPGFMMQLALIGFAWTWMHPRARRGDGHETTKTE